MDLWNWFFKKFKNGSSKGPIILVNMLCRNLVFDPYRLLLRLKVAVFNDQLTHWLNSSQQSPGLMSVFEK